MAVSNSGIEYTSTLKELLNNQKQCLLELGGAGRMTQFVNELHDKLKNLQFAVNRRPGVTGHLRFIGWELLQCMRGIVSVLSKNVWNREGAVNRIVWDAIYNEPDKRRVYVEPTKHFLGLMRFLWGIVPLQDCIVNIEYLNAYAAAKTNEFAPWCEVPIFQITDYCYQNTVHEECDTSTSSRNDTSMDSLSSDLEEVTIGNPLDTDLSSAGNLRLTTKNINSRHGRVKSYRTKLPDCRRGLHEVEVHLNDGLRRMLNIRKKDETLSIPMRRIVEAAGEHSGVVIVIENRLKHVYPDLRKRTLRLKMQRENGPGWYCVTDAKL